MAKPLYNGNIATMATDIPKFEDLGGESEFTQQFSYDQLNRIKASQELTGNGYKTSYMYDPSGNITELTRNDSAGSALDRLKYNYENKAKGYKYNTNKLRWVDDDPALNAASNTDIDDQEIDNYDYDDIGNLKRDNQEEIREIKWTVYGKVQSVVRTANSQKPDLEFAYDASGNRISKKVINKNGTVRTTFYIRDASGNVMAVYEKENNGSMPVIAEQHIYGSQRLGIFRPTVSSLPIGKHYVGYRSYELSDHLGNVSVTLSDYKFSGVRSAVNYYPFNSIARSYQINDYRFGQNTQERVSELGDNHYTAMYWEYDARLVRRWNLDPKPNLSISQYSCFNGNPYLLTDFLGDTTAYYNIKTGALLGTINDNGAFTRVKIDAKLYNDQINHYRKFDMKLNDKYNATSFVKSLNNLGKLNEQVHTGTDYISFETGIRMTFTGNTDLSNTIIPQSSIDNGKAMDFYATGILRTYSTFDNGTELQLSSLSARSGPWGNSALPNGDYTASKIVNTTESGMVRDGIGFKVYLNDNVVYNRTSLRIHPDQEPQPGSAGCIGLVCGADDLKKFAQIVRRYFDNKSYSGSFGVNVNITNNPNYGDGNTQETGE